MWPIPWLINPGMIFCPHGSMSHCKDCHVSLLLFLRQKWCGHNYILRPVNFMNFLRAENFKSKFWLQMILWKNCLNILSCFFCMRWQNFSANSNCSGITTFPVLFTNPYLPLSWKGNSVSCDFTVNLKHKLIMINTKTLLVILNDFICKCLKFFVNI